MYDTDFRGAVVPTSIRLDQETESAVRRLARKSGRTKSSIIREAIARMAEEMEITRPKPEGTLYDRMTDLVGIGHGGPHDLAARSEEVLRNLFSQRQRRR